jgi:3-oxoacyl-[acyl-carrier-protein] synthase III
MTYTRFESLGVYLPASVVSTAELVERMGFTPPFDLEEITGIVNRRVHDRSPENFEDSFVLALRAARDCLARSRYQPDGLDVIISCSITRSRDGERHYYEPSFAHLLARALGAGSAMHFDVSNACAGMMTGVLLLDRMIKAGLVRNGLVVSGERITPIAETAVREVAEPYDPQFGSLTVGDSGAAVILDESPDAEDRIHDLELMTCAEHSHLCIGMPSDRDQGLALYTDNHQMHKEDRLRLFPSMLRDYLAARGRSFAGEGFDYVIHHQVGARFITRMSATAEQVLGTPMPPALSAVAEYGNTSSTSHFLVLHDHLRDHPEARDAKYLLVPAASGVVTGFVSASLKSLTLNSAED